MFTRYIVGFAIYCALVLPLSFGQDAGGKSFGNATPVNGESVDQQFRKLTEEVVAAEVSGDLAAMDRFFADNYIHTHSSGWVENKTEFMSLYRNGKRKYNAADIRDVQVRFYGDSAVVNGTEHINELNGDHQYLFLCVWVRQNGAWRLAAWVANPVPKRSGPPDNFK